MKKIILLLTLGLIAATATAEITFVNSDSAYELITVIGTPTDLTVSAFDAGSAADTYLVVAIATKMRDDLANPVNSVSFKGTPLTKIGEELVNDTYEGWAVLYGGVASGSGDVVMNYTAETLDTAYDSEGVSFCVASYSDVSGFGVVSAGANDNGSPSSLSDSITTTNDNSLVVSSLMLGSGADTITGSGSTVVRESAAVADDKVDCGLLELTAPTAGTYAPGATFPGQNRATMISVELVEQAAPKATTFIVR